MGDPRLAWLRTLIRRAEARCGERVADLRRAHGWLLEIARRLEPGSSPETGLSLTGAQVRERVEAYLDEVASACAAGEVPAWLRPQVEHVGIILRRLGPGLYHCYHVPVLPRTNNDLEPFYRRLKTPERRITGHRRSGAFVVRVGGFAVYATAASGTAEAALQQQLAAVPAAEYLASAAEATFGAQTLARTDWLTRRCHALKHGDPADVLAALLTLPTAHARDPQAAARAQATSFGYLAKRWDQIQCATFRAAGYPIGSGCVETANKLVVEARLKGPGMH